MAAILETPPRLRLTTDDFYLMGEMGLFRGKNVILVDGELIDMPAEGARHFTAIQKAIKSLEAVYPAGFVVRRPGPLQLSLATDPEPDVAVVRGELMDFAQKHPTHAELVIEMSETTLRYDRRFKMALYAKANITEYWIVVLPERVLEVYKEPALRDGAWSYAPVRRYFPGDQVEPPFAGAAVDVADLMV